MPAFDPPFARLRPPGNRLLASLDAADLAEVLPRLERVELAMRDVLHVPEQPVAHVYFPESGYISRLAPMDDGDFVEVGLIGPEGMVGLPVLLGNTHDSFESMVQLPCRALRIEAQAFREIVARRPTLQRALLRYALAHFEEVARSAACNSRHSVEQRLARWMLMAHDRIEDDAFPMTHEFLAMMLGIRRAGVTTAAGLLQKSGLIRYQRGRMAVTDRPGLEAVACECYGIGRRAIDRLIGPHRRRSSWR